VQGSLFGSILRLMFNHAPADYDCPFCLIVHGQSDAHNDQHDIIYKNEYATALISAKWWVNNPGHAFVIPNKHYENIYDIPDDELAEVYKVVKKVAIAIRTTYDCDGTSTRQHNEPAGNQDVWHLHVHVFPRYEDDQLYANQNQNRFTSSDERQPYAEKLRGFLATNK
jgi:histidine triad (HIT) family protein